MADEKIDFGSETVSKEYEELGIFGGTKFVKVPEVGTSVTLIVNGIEEDTTPRRLSKEGKEFTTGFKDKNGEIISYDLVTDQGRFNLKGAMLYYGVGSLLKDYAKKHPGLSPSYAGAKVTIKHAFDGNHANMKLSDLQKIKGYATMDETVAYQNEVKKAMKEFKIYEFKLEN